jgi:hypothetical protein
MIFNTFFISRNYFLLKINNIFNIIIKSYYLKEIINKI